MGDERDARIARNESLFREANDAIERGLWPGQSHGAVRFRCECARFDCGGAVELDLGDYERVRQNPNWFLVVPGHEMPDLEVVVERHPNLLVVAKHGEAGEVAERHDPRD